MNDMKIETAAQEAIEWALMHGMAMKTAKDTATHCAFSFAPTLIQQDRFEQLRQVAPVIGKLIHGVSENHSFLEQAIAPLTTADPFFKNLLALHRNIHKAPTQAARIPMLLMRTDFMDDVVHGPKLIEFNGIAAGMGPFGQRIHQLHHYLQEHWPAQFQKWSEAAPLSLVPNRAIDLLADGIADTARNIRDASGESGQPLFMMVVQPDEDNVYDQHLLELAIQARGVKTVRRTFRQLHDQLSTGQNQRLLLKNSGGVDAIYLRAGYQYSDYVAHDLEEARCCEALSRTRSFIEHHRVALNATVGQQLATSKKVQMLLSSMEASGLTQFGVTLDEARQIKSVLGEMRPVDENSLAWFNSEDAGDWVLKNQGEGGGHCIFDEDIQPKLSALQPEEYQAWSIMRRLHPSHRSHPALLVRKGETMPVDDLISEIGLFTLHVAGKPVTSEEGYAGYLIRSKPSTVTEGGVHSGMGAVDSLAISHQA